MRLLRGKAVLSITRPRFAGVESLLLPEPSARIGMAHGSLRFTALF